MRKVKRQTRDLHDKRLKVRETARLKILHVLKRFHGTTPLSSYQISKETSLPIQTVYFYTNHYLRPQGLVESPKKGYYVVTGEGLSYLAHGGRALKLVEGNGVVNE